MYNKDDWAAETKKKSATFCVRNKKSSAAWPKEFIFYFCIQYVLQLYVFSKVQNKFPVRRRYRNRKS